MRSYGESPGASCASGLGATVSLSSLEWVAVRGFVMASPIYPLGIRIPCTASCESEGRRRSAGVAVI